MDIVQSSIKKPVTVLVAVILTVLFGLIALFKMPYQLSPDVTEPEITVTTIWSGATPYEIERDIIEEQEKVLKGIPGLIEMESSSFNGQGNITLRFRIGTDVDNALLRVSNKMNEVRSYPVNVDKPVINATGTAASPVIWMIMKTSEGNPDHIYNYKTFFENEIRQYLERVEGVADLFIGGGTEKEMHIIVSPDRLAAYGLTINEVMNVLRTENVNVSAGIMGVGRRDYRIRTVAEFSSPEDIKNIVIRSTGQQRIILSDIAEVQFGYEKRTVAMIHNGESGIAVGVRPEPGTNILDLTDRVEEVVKWLNENKLKPEGIHLSWVYDQRPYINSAINLVKQDIYIGGLLAVAVLLIFLRNISSTIITASAIPVSVIGTFIFMQAMGRNLNVVSLAGLSFAIGIFVDNAIVVLENIDRHRKMGKSSYDAAYYGAKEVWGAIVASSLTNVAVFLPIMFVKDEAGQLFMDIAIAITFATTISLFVSISVIPMLSEKLFRLSGDRTTERFAVLGRIGGRLEEAMMRTVHLAVKNRFTRITTVSSLTFFAVVVTLLMIPKMEYLPQGNRNLVINILIPPPGLSYEEKNDIGKQFFRSVEPNMNKDHNGYPGIENMFYVGAEQIMLSGAISTHEQRAGELVPLFMQKINAIPGMFGVSSQAGIFQTSLGRGRAIEVDISGNDLNQLIGVAGTMFGMITNEIHEAQIRPIPSLELLFPEARLLPERDRLKAAGLTADDFGVAVDVLMDGRKIGEFKEEGQKKIDMVMKARQEGIRTPEELYRTMISTPQGKVIPVSSVSALEKTSGITEIRHLERNRTITLQVTPPFSMPIEEAMEIIDSKIIPVVKNQGMMQGVNIRLSGVADKLTETRKALQWNLILAALITYLLMAALYENFIYPLIIMFSVPLAGAGGFIGLKLVSIFIAPQPLDILTMLGFVILIGVVVNNAILIVHQSLNNIREHGMEHREAVLDATRTRLRPIYMAAFTSIFGMLPLVVAPGPGSELYRGLGSVIVGGLALSTVFTVFVIPSLLMFAIKMEKVETRD